MDSCDASGEYTTGESDIEKQSETSEDHQSNSTTYQRLDLLNLVSQKSNSQELLEDKIIINQPIETSTPKVQLRKKSLKKSIRPWSVSCISQITKSNNDDDTRNNKISQFSISETALNQLFVNTHKTPIKAESLDAS